MNIKDFGEKFINAEKEAWQKGNFGPLETLEDPHVVYHLPLLPDIVGFEGVKQYILGITGAVSELRQVFKYIAGDGSLFVLAYKSSGRGNGQSPMVPADKFFTGDYLFAFLTKKGRVVEAWANGSMNVSELPAQGGQLDQP